MRGQHPRMDLSATPLTTPIDVRFVPAHRGTLLNASRRSLKRSITLAPVIAMWAYALRIFVSALALGSAAVASALALGSAAVAPALALGASYSLARRGSPFPGFGLRTSGYGLRASGSRSRSLSLSNLESGAWSLEPDLLSDAVQRSAARSRSTSINPSASGYSATCARVDDD
jgi:hypothetical protein